MKNIFRQLGVISGYFCLWYLFFLLLSYVFYPVSGTVDNSKVKTNLLNDEAFSDLLGLWTIKNSATQRIFIMGASNTRGIDPDLLKAKLPDFSINNLCVGSSNITEVRQVYELTRLAYPGDMKKTIYIIGLGYVLFEGDHFNKSNGLEVRAAWSGLYKVKNKKFELAIDRHLMPLVSNLSRPLYMWRIVFEDIKDFYDNSWVYLQSLMGKHQVVLPEEVVRQSALDAWKIHLGNFKNYMEGPQADYLVSLSHDILKSGASLVIVDLAAPQWLRDRSEYYKKYIQKRASFLYKIINQPGVSYIDLSKSVPDSDFIDSTHPTEETAKKWSETIAEFIVAQRKVLGF